MKLKAVLASMIAGLGVAGGAAAQQASATQQAPAANDDPAALRAEIERLKTIVPGQAFAMTQVAYNFNNLWFAAHAENWPLAQFYVNETRTRLRWALRITPVRKISTGDLQLQPLLDALEKDPFAKVGEAVAAKNVCLRSRPRTERHSKRATPATRRARRTISSSRCRRRRPSR